ncbi:reverse transcriptase domain-containing protein [Tanacetum coccineum]|uniref:Reverse transcriptase domain-containing protein n=1 Tax=Tanacetum coccineum TaxID=301880 RepID=A0ABQ4X488_9ASTR
MERGFLSSSSMDKKQNGKRKEKGTTLGNLAKRVKNIDGKIVGKDGKPLKMPFRNVNTTMNATIQGLDEPVVGNEKDRNVEDVSNAADVEDVAADMREWDTFVNNHSHAHVLEVADVTKGDVDDTPSRKVSISPIVSIHEFEIEQDTLDETMMNTQHLGDGLVADKRTPMYVAIVNPMSSPNTFNTPPLKSFNSVLNPTNDVEGLDAVTDMDANDTPNGSPTMALASCENLQNSERVNFRSLLNEENVESYDCVLPQAVADVVKSRYENTLVGYFLGTSLAFPIVQKYVNNAWSNFGLQNLMKTDDGVFMFKFASKEGLENVLQRGSWMIRKSPIILTKWSPNLSLKKGEVTCVPVWVKLHGVPILAFSGDGLSLIATQIGKPLLLDAFTSSMCKESWGRISYARALIEVNSKSDLKTKVTMAIPNEKEDGYTKAVIRVEYEWKPPHYADCKIFGHDLLHCPKHVAVTVPNDPSKIATVATKSDGFTKVKRKNHKGKKADMQPRSRQIDGFRLNKPQPNFHWQKKGNIRRGADMDPTTKVGTNSMNMVKGPSTSNSFDALNTMNVEDECGTSSSRGNLEEEQVEGTKESHLNEHVESDGEVDEFIFPEGDKFGDKFDIRLKGQVRK